MPAVGSAAGMGPLEDIEAATEDVALMTGGPAGSGSNAEPGANSSGEIPTSFGNCRICLETSPLEELEEACSCKGSLQRVHHACLQRWIDERDLPRNSAGQALVCEICKQPYKDGFRPPPPRPSMPSRRVERVMIGQDLYVIVVDSETGERLGTARPIRAFNDYEDREEEEDYPARHLNPVSACAISFFLFMMSSVLLSHLFTSLPGTSAGDPSGGDSSIPSPIDDEQNDEQFQDLSMTLLLLWLMLRLLVLVAPVYTISRMFERARLARTRADSGSGDGGNDGVELGVVVELAPPVGVPAAHS